MIIEALRQMTQEEILACANHVLNRYRMEWEYNERISHPAQLLKRTLRCGVKSWALTCAT